MSLKVYAVLNVDTNEVIGLYRESADADARCEKQGQIFENHYEVDEWFVH